MEIDIVDLTAEEYQNLNAVQISMVRVAQAKKNALLKAAEEKKKAVLRKLVFNRFEYSTLYPAETERIDAEAQEEIRVLQDDLKHQLAYEQLLQTGNENGLYSYPENPNYYLPYNERFLIVRNYYMNRTSDPNARLAAFQGDTLAREYLGEYYATLHDLLASYC